MIPTDKRHNFRGWLRAMLVAWGALFPAPVIAADSAKIDFERQISPLVINRCLDCHHPGKTSGGLDLSTSDAARRGGESGAAVTPRKPDDSMLWTRVAAGEMPPPGKHSGAPLSAVEREALRSWILAGADWPQGRQLGLHEKSIDLDEARSFWSFRPVKRPPLPIVAAEFAAHPLDAFLADRWAAHELTPAEPASDRQWLRRAWLDVVGLPPSVEEQARFLKDPSPERYATTVDVLLAHRGYGERWGRHWLDLVRYADSNGYERDGAKPNVWRYRDYVIDSLNADLPYDRFVLEQIAGDEIPDRTSSTVIATGFHALGTWQDEVDPLEQPQYRADELDDMLRTFSQTFLGLTLGCARCHQHKYDPLSMVDYYGLAAVFSPMKRPNVGRADRDLPAGSWAELTALETRDRKIAALKRQIDELRAATEQAWIDSGRSKILAEALRALRSPAEKRNAEQKRLAQEHAAAWREELSAAETDSTRQAVADLDREIQQLREACPDLPRGYFLFEDTVSPPETFLLLSGRASNPGPKMLPRVPAVLDPKPLSTTSLARSTGRRLALAQWLIDPANPLTARVMVNRVWQHHFGVGLVATPSDFGHLGAPPTHPELLDWLADWFVHDADWSLKKLHRLIMTSRAYRLSSTTTAQQLKLEPENHLLSRFPCRRLEVEAIRDSMLAVSGKLDRRMHGPAVYLPIADEVIEAHTDKSAAWKPSREPDINRRTIYGYVKRTLAVPMLEVLDFCDTTNSTDKRSITSIAPQSLALFNGEFVNRQAAYLADRLVREVGADRAQQIDRAYQLLLCREPTAAERERLSAFIAAETAADDDSTGADRKALIQMCRVLLNLNEFVYVD